MIQPILNQIASINSDLYYNPISGEASSVQAQVEAIFPTACTLQYLSVAPRSTLAFGSITFTVYKNNSATSMVVVINTASGTTTVTDSTHPVSFAANDKVYFRAVRAGGINPAFVFDYEFGYEASAADSSIYGWGSADTAMFPGPEYTGAFSGVKFNAAVNNADVVGIAGSITGLSVSEETAPGVGNADIFHIVKNGTVQDGTGGTVNTTLTVSGTGTSDHGTFSLPVSNGDTVTIRHTTSGSVSNHKSAGLTTFTSNTASAWNLIGRSVTGLSVGSSPPLYNFPWPAERVGLTTTDTQRLRVLRTGFSLTDGIQWKLTTAPGAAASGKSWTLTLRKNSANTATTATIFETATSATGGTGVSVPLAVGDYISIVATAVNSPANSGAHYWSFPAAIVIPPVDVPVTTIAGSTRKPRRHTLFISEVTNGRNTLSCEIVSTTSAYRPLVDEEVIIEVNSERIFGGTIDSTTETAISTDTGTGIVTRLSVNDFNSLADRRYVKGTLAGGSLESILTTLVTDYLSTYGVTLDAAQVTGPTLDALTYDYRQLTEVLNDLATLSGYVWEIDYDKVLRMYSPGTVSAPFTVVTGNGNAIGDIAVDQTARTKYANRIYVRAGTASIVEKQDAWVSDGVATTYPLTYDLQDISGDPYLAFVGVVVVNGTIFETIGTGATNWSYDRPTNSIIRTAALTFGDTISVNYWVQFPITVIAEDTGEQATYGLIERMIEKPDVFDILVAQAIADAELAIALSRPNVVRYQTRHTGLRVGMTQTITVTARNINDTYLVSDIRTRDSGDDRGTLIRDVTATQGTTIKPTWREYYKKIGSTSGSAAPVA